MRRSGLNVVVALGLVACSTAPPTAPPSAISVTRSATVTAANIEKVRGELPPGYEIADLSAPASPVRLWGFGADWIADPPRCAALGDPVPGPTAAAGLSASGPGGIVYAAVTGSPPAPLNADPGVIAECGRWTVTSGRTTATVSLIDAPPIDGVATVGMATEATTTVEGGNETDTQARTFTAYLGDYVAIVAVVSDPGLPSPALGPDFAGTLLVKTVSALRG